MPWRPCGEPGCPELTEQTYCDAHRRERYRAADKARGTAAARGYDADYQRLRDQVIAEEVVCWLCGKPVDKTISGRLPDGPSVDHVLPLAHGGGEGRENLRLSHLRCNTARRVGPREGSAPPTRTPPSEPARRYRYGSVGTS